MSEVFTRPVTQKQIEDAKRRRVEKLNEQVQLAYDYTLTDLMARIADLETAAAPKKSVKK